MPGVPGGFVVPIRTISSAPTLPPSLSYARPALAVILVASDATGGSPVYDRMLVPLDGSAAAETALAIAELIPSQRVRLLQVESDTRGPMLVDAHDADAWRAGREASARAYLDRSADGLRRQGREVEPAFAFGDPASRIIAAATDVDLVVMATQGRGAGGRALFGSVADRVARHAPTATLLVRGGARPAAAPPLARIVVPLDGSPVAERAVDAAADVAGPLGLPLHLVRVVEGDTVRASVQAGTRAAAAYARVQEALKREAEAYLAAWVRRLRNRDLAATAEVRTGEPAVELLGAVSAGDLVAMTTHGRGGVRRWLLGSVAEKLVRLAPGPVLLVRDASRPMPPARAADGG